MSLLRLKKESLRLNNEHCLLWIKDPSISPFKNKKDILKDKNHLSFLERVKWKCFYNSKLREEIVKQIKELQTKNTLRLYTQNDGFEYSYHFNEEECKKWVGNHLVNPRTNKPLTVESHVYIELLYTALQRKIFGNFMENLPITNKIIARLQLMEDTDKLFLTHNIASFDDKLKIVSPTVPRRKATLDVPSILQKVNDQLQNDKMNVSSSSSSNKQMNVSSSSSSKRNVSSSSHNVSSPKHLNADEERQLRDLILEKKNLLEIQMGKKKRNKKVVDITIFDTFRKFIEEVLENVNELTTMILESNDITNEDKDILASIGIGSLFEIPAGDNYETDALSTFMKNMFVYMIYPNSKQLPILKSYILSYNIHKPPFKGNLLISNIRGLLIAFMNLYPSLVRILRILRYFENIIDNVIPFKIVAKRQIDIRTKVEHSYFKNYYYNILYEFEKYRNDDLKLPKGQVLLGKDLQTKFENLGIELDIDELKEKYNRVITYDHPLYGFTYEECKNWVILPIFHPQTLKRILIDSPIYNHLLCMSYQYDRNLIPRMITSRGYEILIALRKILHMEKDKDTKTFLVPLGKRTANFSDKKNTENKKYKQDGVSKKEKGVSKKEKGLLLGKRTVDFSVHRYYTAAECKLWAKEPYRDPKDSNIVLIPDSYEYNVILEQAILYNITPLPISKGFKKFNKLILARIKPRFLPDVNYESSSQKGKKTSYINIDTEVCNAISNIYDSEEKYKEFKDQMTMRCKRPTESVCINKLKDDIERTFIPVKYPYNSNAIKLIKYYEDSALASLLIAYELMKGKIYSRHKEFFLTEYENFEVSIYSIDSIEDNLVEHKKKATGHGAKREFFTKLFEELFCDDKHLKRPFICPINSIANRYYINPDFEPDEQFRKVIKYHKQTYKHMYTFESESEYDYIYTVIGTVLCIAIVNEDIGLPKQLSSYILSGFTKTRVDDYDILYYYLQEFDGAILYIHWINGAKIKNFYDFDSDSIIYTIRKKSQKITRENYIDFLLKLANHVIKNNHIPSSTKNMENRYTNLFAGFSDNAKKYLNTKNVSVTMLSSLITNEELTTKLLQEFASNIVYTSTLNRKSAILINMKKYISNIITNKEYRYGSDVEHLEFMKKLLQFWTSINYYNRKLTYEIIIKYGEEYMRYPEAHTCNYQLVIFGFPLGLTNHDQREIYIYGKLYEAVQTQVMDLY